MRAHSTEIRSEVSEELELPVIVSHLVWVLGSELRSSGIVVHAKSFISLNVFFFFFFFFQDRVSLGSPGCPGTHSVDQASLKLRNSPASASQVLGLKACAQIS